ncbi:BTAD domain-containing putative transcriptional regulator [Amorphoplanes digitatis]|uniref:DNA-binding SARP family transcriptional activator n=1 Tax=Actinoplanes digitatis TaxID=1868 RepID=A0A7W7I440_9ACTN|nr:BTAD domain-containing putative transcriptional regulator [Actinoplanes digitatis]MBB4766089.1 DNA-binding SARP family transcriptional activator [Actinoplanes digitatis]
MTDAPASLALRFEILGEVRALRGDERLDLGPAKQRAVLAVLLLDAGRPVPTHQIVDAVWGDGPPENGANVVQKYVAGLRRVLEPDRSPRTPGELIALTDGGYVLRTDPGTLDAERFQSGLARASAQRRAGQLAEAAETLREAVALWQGEALAGLPGPVFEAARNRLTDARATAWEKWADIELARGNHTGLMPDLVRLVEQFPLREGLRAQLMIALHQGGRQAEALAVFRDARAYFLDEFGVEPGERMQETHRRILRGEPFYSEPVDPWAASDDIPAPRGPVGVTPPAAPIASGSLAVPPSAYVQQYVPPDPTEIVPAPASPVHPPLSPWGVGAPPPPPAYAVPRRRFPVGEVIFAALTPLVVCSFGSWIYFVYAGARRRDRRQYLVAAGYAALFVVAFVVFAAIDPTSVESVELSNAETIGFLMLLGLPVAASVHGAVLASHPGDTPKTRNLREQARRFALFDPARARQLGIGRPDLLRAFDDGGLVDLNHVPGHELARLPELSSEQAHRIVMDRLNRGPYHRPDELIARGVLPARTVARLAGRLICLPPTPLDTPSGWHSPHSTPHG